MSHPLVDRIRDADAAVRVRACNDIAKDPSAVLLLDALCEALGDSERDVQRAATDGLVALSGRHPEVETQIRQVLRAGEPRARWGALDTARRLGPPEPGWLPAIVESLADARGDVRWTAARLLVALGRLHGETFPVAAGLVRDDARAQVRRMAIFCASELAPDSPETRALLADATRDRDAEVRRAARIALSASDAKTAVD